MINRKTILLPIIITVLLISIISIREVMTVNKIKVNAANIHTVSGSKQRIKINIKRPIKWSSSNKKIVKVDNRGNVQCLASGKAIITGQYLWKKVKCEVTVDTPVLNQTSLSLCVGDIEYIKAENTTIKGEAVADNDLISYKDGKVTAIKPGKSGLTVNIENSSLHCDIEIKEPVIAKDIKIKKGKEEEIKTENWPTNANIKWSSSNEDIAKAEQNNEGKVIIKGLNTGKAAITANINGCEYTTNITVTGKQNLEIEENSVDKGEKLTLHLKNYIKGYKVSWEGATGKEDGTAEFEGKERGIFKVKAKVDTGAGEQEVEKDIQVREKILNLYEWKGSPGTSFELTLQDAENPEYKFDDSLLEHKDNIFTAKAPGETMIEVIDGKTDLLCNITITNTGQTVIEQAKRIASIMNDDQFYYDNSGCSHSLESALDNNNPKSNCGIYVSWILQEAGLLEKDKTIYYLNGLQGSGTSYLESSDKVTISYPETRPKETDLSPGDVCCFMLNSRVGHVAVYAGESEDGDPLWYTGGKDATDSKGSGGTYIERKCGPVKQRYYNEIECLIHPN